MPDTSSKLHSKIFFLTIVGFVLQYILNVYLARNFSVAVYGDYSIAIKSLEIITSIVLLATDVGVVSILPVYLKAHAENSIRTYISWNIKLVAINFFIVRLLAVLTVLLVLGLHFLGIRDIRDYPVVVFVLWVAPSSAAFTLFAAFLFCYGQALFASICKHILLLSLQLILFFVAFHFFPHSLHPYILICLVLLCDYFILTPLLYRRLDTETRKVIRFGLKQILRTPISGHDSWVKKAKKILTIDIIHQIIIPLQLVIVKIFAKDPLSVGQYAAILTICYIMTILTKNFCQQLKATAVADLATEDGREQIKKRINRIQRDIFIAVLLTFCSISFFAKPLLNLFGFEFALVRDTLIIVAIGTFYFSINTISQRVLIYSGYEHLIITPIKIRLVASLIFASIAMYKWGINGIALASIAIDGSYVVWCNFIAYKTIKIKFMTLPWPFRFSVDSR